MTKIEVTDVQGFALSGFNFPYARYLLLELLDPAPARDWLFKLLNQITTGQRWEKDKKPATTLNIAFTFNGLVKLELPLATLITFPLEFQDGMKARADILGDTGKNDPEQWDPEWKGGRIHVWLCVHALSAEVLNRRCDELRALMDETKGDRGAVAGRLRAQVRRTLLA
jgi:hypothetical protein